MFFVTKNGVRKEVTKGIRPMLRVCEMTGGIPDGFWEDLTILGFLSGTIHGLVRVISSGKYKGADSGEIAIGVFDDLRGAGDGVVIGGKIALLTQFPVSTFADAFKAGFVSVMIAHHGVGNMLDEPIVKKAKAYLQAAPMETDGTEKSALSAAIIHLAFHYRVMDMQQGA